MLVPAAHAPMYGVFSSCHTGTWARATVVCSPPKTATTFSRSTSSRAMVTPFCGLPSSSRTTSSSFRPPSTPPLALISSMAICSPRLMASPEAAEPPETAAESPILTGSLDWASAGAVAASATDMSEAMTTAKRCMRSSLRGRGLLLGRRDAVALELAVEVAPLDAEPLGGARHVPLVRAQLAQDIGALEGLAGLLEGLVLRGLVDRPAFPRAEGRGKVFGADDVAGSHDDEPLDHVPELAHVARPVVGEEIGESLHRDGLGPPAVLGREQRDEVLDEGGEVLFPLPEGRHLDGDDGEPVEEILAEAAGRDLLLEVLVGGGEHAHVQDRKS